MRKIHQMADNVVGKELLQICPTLASQYQPATDSC